MDCFTRVENIPKTVLRKVAEKITWDNTGDYMDHFDDMPSRPEHCRLCAPFDAACRGDGP